MFQHILIATDGSSAMSHATKYVATVFPNSVFHIISVINISDDSVPMTDTVKNNLEKAANDFVAKDAKLLRDMGFTPAKTSIVMGVPSKEILKYCDDHHIELLVMARTGKECPVHLGATCIHTLEVSHCPILMVPPEADIKTPKKIFNPTSGSHFSVSASELAVLVADNFSAELHSLYTGKHDHIPTLRQVESIAQKISVTFKGEKMRGQPDVEILNKAEKYDMMVFSRGHGGLAYMMRKLNKKVALGKLEREVIGASPVPMIVVSD